MHEGMYTADQSRNGFSRMVELEDAAVVPRVVVRVDTVVEPRAAERARALVEAATAALEEDEQLFGSPLRNQKEYGPPRAHFVFPPGDTFDPFAASAGAPPLAAEA